MRKTKRSLMIGITIAILGLPIASWADNDDRANFSTATGTLHIPKLNVDGVNILNSVEVKFDFATQLILYRRLYSGANITYRA